MTPIELVAGKGLPEIRKNASDQNRTDAEPNDKKSSFFAELDQMRSNARSEEVGDVSEVSDRSGNSVPSETVLAALKMVERDNSESPKLQSRSALPVFTDPVQVPKVDLSLMEIKDHGDVPVADHSKLQSVIEEDISTGDQAVSQTTSDDPRRLNADKIEQKIGLMDGFLSDAPSKDVEGLVQKGTRFSQPAEAVSPSNLRSNYEIQPVKDIGVSSPSLVSSAAVHENPMHAKPETVKQLVQTSKLVDASEVKLNPDLQSDVSRDKTPVSGGLDQKITPRTVNLNEITSTTFDATKSVSLGTPTSATPNPQSLIDFSMEEGDVLRQTDAALSRDRPLPTQVTSTPVQMAGPHSRQIVGQITAGLSQLVDGTVEIRLNPAELGRITIQLMEVTGGGLSASVMAEKPEVLDLLRRNENLLDAEFDNAGIDLASLNFSQKDDAKDDQAEELVTYQIEENEGEVETSGAFNRADRLANLDIRL